MNSQPPRRFTGLAVAIIVAALVISAGIYTSSYFGPATTVTRTSTVTTTATLTTTMSTTIVSYVSVYEGPLFYTSGVSPEGLQLKVMLNSSSIQSHGAVAVQIELLNTLNRNVSLAVVANRDISEWNEGDFFCSDNPSRSLVGFALFKGHISAENISAGSPLQLTAPVALPCMAIFGLNGTTFLPNSDETISFSYLGQTQESSYPVTAEVNATTGYCVASDSSGGCRASSGLFGYWNPGFGNIGNATLASKDFVYFPSGEYTIVATDDWNQYVYAYIVVL